MATLFPCFQWLVQFFTGWRSIKGFTNTVCVLQAQFKLRNSGHQVLRLFFFSFFSIPSKYAKSHIHKTTCFLRETELWSHPYYGEFLHLFPPKKKLKYLKVWSRPENFGHNAFSSANQAEDTCWCQLPYPDGTHILWQLLQALENTGYKMVKLNRKIQRLNNNSKIKIIRFDAFAYWSNKDITNHFNRIPFRYTTRQCYLKHWMALKNFLNTVKDHFEFSFTQ